MSTNMSQGTDVFQKSLPYSALDESSVSIGRVKRPRDGKECVVKAGNQLPELGHIHALHSLELLAGCDDT